MCSGTSGSTVNWCIGSILPSAATRLATSSRTAPGLGARRFEIRMTFLHADAEPEEQHQQHEQREGPVADKRPGCPGPIRSPPRRPERRSDDRRACCAIRLPGFGCVHSRSASLPPAAAGRAARSSESSRASGGSFGTSSVSSVAMLLPCASPLPESRGQARARNMAANEPAKARPLYEPAPAIVNRSDAARSARSASAAIIGDRRGLPGARRRHTPSASR